MIIKRKSKNNSKRKSNSKNDHKKEVNDFKEKDSPFKKTGVVLIV